MAVSSLSAFDIAQLVRSGTLSALEVVTTTLVRIERLNPKLRAFTDVTATRALERAHALDARRARGEMLPSLAGVPLAVKNLFDVQGLATRAGSKINRERAPAAQDATLIARLEKEGAILVGALNMGEYAYDFTGENVHDGASLNPHDLGRMSGGSSGGSGTAIAAGLAALSLGSDTNGSIRVPSSFCGLYGLKPTYGRLSRAFTYPFVHSLDHLGPMARSPRDLALSYDAMQGPDDSDPHLRARPVELALPSLAQGIDQLRIAILDDHFVRNGDAPAFAAVAHVARALGATARAILPEAHRARAAAYVITAAEGADLHFERIRHRPQDYDPDTRDRFLAGTMIPAIWVQRAHKFRHWFRAQALRLFETADILLAPSTPCVAPKSGQKVLTLDGHDLPLRPNIGIFTQPISFIGLPVVSVPVWLADQHLPIGVQIIAPPWREDLALRVAEFLDRTGTTKSPVAKDL